MKKQRKRRNDYIEPKMMNVKSSVNRLSDFQIK